MEIIRNVALYAGWGFVAILALFAIGVAFLLIQSRSKPEEEVPKEGKGKRGTSALKKPQKAQSLVQKVSQVSKEESSRRILGNDAPPLPAGLPSPQNLPAQSQLSQPIPVQLPQMVSLPKTTAEIAPAESSGSFVNLPSSLPEPPKL